MKSNWLDKTIGFFSPKAELERLKCRAVKAAYEAAKPDRTRTGKVDNSSPDLLTLKAGENLHGFARHLEQNNDLCFSVLRTKTDNSVGAKGINIEPMPLKKDGTIHTTLKKQLMREWERWCESPEVSREFSYSDCERLAFWAKMRDGEIFIQLLVGNVPTLRHASAVPLSIELIERDFLPTWNNGGITRTITDSNGKTITIQGEIQQSIERNAWGQPVNYYALKDHPQGVNYKNGLSYRTIPAERMLHLKRVTRAKQSRGVTMFAQVIKSLEWVGSYLRSESIAALTASMFAVVIKKGESGMYDTETTTGKRALALDAGIVVDDLLPGESLDVVNSNRPNAASTPFIDLMTKFMCGALGAAWSNVTNNYAATYTSLRAERSDAQRNYEAEANEFIGQMTKPIYKKWVELAILSGVIKLPADLDFSSIYDASYSSPVMPELDPWRNARANETYISNGIKSTPQIIRENGGNPDKVLEEESEWQTKVKKKKMWFNPFKTDPNQNNQAA